MTSDAAVETNTHESRSRKLCVALLVLAAATFVWVRAPLVSVPLERDEGEYAYIAQRMLAGDVPYRDAFDQKPPAVFVAYLIAFSTLGESTEAIHLFMYLWTALTAIVLHQAVRRVGGGLAAAFSTAIFAVASGTTALTGNAANTEIFMLLPMVGAVACMLRALDTEFSWRWWILCGALAALACWFKQVAATNVLFVAMVPAAVALRDGRAGAIRGLGRIYAALALGGFLVSGSAVALLATSGAWDAFTDAVILHNLDYSQNNSLASGVAAMRRRIAEQAPGYGIYWVLALAGAVLPGIVPARARGVLFGWLVASVAGVSVGLYFRPHYFFQLLPALSGLAGCVLATLANRVNRSSRAAVAIAGAAILAALAVAAPLISEAPVRAAGSPAAVSRSIYGVNPFVESAEIGKYIRRTSAPDDTVYIVGSEPQILFYAKRASATRYIFFYPLTGDYPGVLERQQEVAANVDAMRPRYIVWSNIATSLLLTEGTEPFLLDHALAMIARDYRLEFVAHPVPSHEQFEFVYGVEARQLMHRARDRADEAQWIALYRRR